jgi:hypothetical protein
MKRLAILLALCSIASAQSAPEHLYPTDDEAVELYKIQLQRQHVVEDANEKIIAINSRLQSVGDKIVKDHHLEGQFTFNPQTAQFEPVKKPEPKK